MREPGRGGGTVVAAVVAVLEKQQALNGNCNFPLKTSLSTDKANVKLKGFTVKAGHPAGSGGEQTKAENNEGMLGAHLRGPPQIPESDEFQQGTQKGSGQVQWTGNLQGPFAVTKSQGSCLETRQTSRPETSIETTKQMETRKLRSPTNVLNAATKNNICLGDSKEIRYAQSRVENTQAQFSVADDKKCCDSFENSFKKFNFNLTENAQKSNREKDPFKTEVTVENCVVFKNHRIEANQKVEGLSAPKEFPATISDDYGSDSSDEESSSSDSDSDSGKGVHLNDGLETITEEDRLTASSANSTGIYVVSFNLLMYPSYTINRKWY